MVKNLPADAGDLGLIPRLGQSPGEGVGNPLQYSCLGSPMHGGACWATLHVSPIVGHNLAIKQQRLPSTENSTQSSVMT